MPPPSPPSLSESILVFLRQHGMAAGAPLIPMTGGANNRVYRITRPGGEDAVLKCYFQNPNDPRDRFCAEQSFYQWIWSRPIRRTPEPLAWSTREKLGLFAFVEGRKLQPEEVTGARVQEALDFLAEINAGRDAASSSIPLASEACFSLGEHLACVDRRVARLEQIAPHDELHSRALDFVRVELRPSWTRMRERILRKASDSRLDTAHPLPPAQRCLSPSDFGFHNAILGPAGRLRFLDFEYAGWDDPAKLICDFFSQPSLAVSHSHWDMFLKSVTALGSDPALPERASLLLPAYQVKWCCIMLNEFIRSDEARRQFAAGAALPLERKAAQLAHAQQALARAAAAGS
jgi:hypothetical protein